MTMKTHEAVLKTGGRTLEELGLDPDIHGWERSEQVRASYDLIDGCTVIVGETSFRDDGYSLLMWQELDDHKFMEFVYISEQDEIIGNYVNLWDEFEEDWKNDEYEPPGALVFPKEYVVLKAGEKNGDS